MSGLCCLWATFPEGREEWYENEYLPSIDSPNAIHGIHCEVTASGMEDEPVGKLDSPWPYMTVWEVKSVDQSNKDMYDLSYHPPSSELQSSLKDLRFDIRSYREIKAWKQDDWSGDGGGKITGQDQAGDDGLMSIDIEYVASVAAMEWNVAADKEEEVLKYYKDVVGPTISSSPDVLRFRLFKIDNATTMQGAKFENKSKDELHSYFTLVELESEQWPWDVVVDLAEDDRWKNYFEGQQVVVCQLSALVKLEVANKETEMAACSLPDEESLRGGKESLFLDLEAGGVTYSTCYMRIPSWLPWEVLAASCRANPCINAIQHLKTSIISIIVFRQQSRRT
jgi:hypothetical protein